MDTCYYCKRKTDYEQEKRNNNNICKKCSNSIVKDIYFNTDPLLMTDKPYELKTCDIYPLVFFLAPLVVLFLVHLKHWLLGGSF